MALGNRQSKLKVKEEVEDEGRERERERVAHPDFMNEETLKKVDLIYQI